MSLISAFTEAYRLLEKTDIKKRDTSLCIKVLWAREVQDAMSTTSPNGEGTVECPSEEVPF